MIPAIVGIFFLVVFLIGVWDRKKVDIEDYWVNGRRTGKFALVATITSTFLGVGALLSNAGIAYSGGGLATLVLMSSFFFYFFIFTKFFVPKIKEFGDNQKAYTTPDYFAFRFDKKTQIAGIVLNLITYSLFLALQILGMGIFVSAVGGFDPNIATLIGGAIVVIYTVVGGLRADIRTDIFQFFVMLSLFIVLPVIITKTGGFDVILSLPKDFLIGKEFAPWYVFLLGFLFLGASNLVSADLWQRVYASESKESASKAFFVSGLLVFLFLLAGTLLGIFGKILLPIGISENSVVPELLKLILPEAVLGLVIAGFFAAIMSSSDTLLLILSMTLVHDLYQKALGKIITPERALVLSRLTTFVVGTVATIIAVIVFNVVHVAIQAITFYVALMPAVIFGFYYKKATAFAAFWSIVAGTITVFVFLFISPVEAFIPGLIISFLSFFSLNRWALKRGLA